MKRNILTAIIFLSLVGCTENAVVGGDETWVGTGWRPVEELPRAETCESVLLIDEAGSPIEGRFSIIDLETISDGSFFILGKETLDNGEASDFVLKTASDGTVLWKTMLDRPAYKLMPGTSNFGTEGGAFVITQTYFEEPDSVTHITGAAAEIAYYDADGVNSWSFALPAPTIAGETVYPIFKKLPDGRMYVVGNFIESVSLSPLFVDDPMILGEVFQTLDGNDIGMYVAVWSTMGALNSGWNIMHPIIADDVVYNDTDFSLIALGRTPDEDKQQVLIGQRGMDVIYLDKIQNIDVTLVDLGSRSVMLMGTYGPDMSLEEASGVKVTLDYPANAQGAWPFIARISGTGSIAFANAVLDPYDENAVFDPSTGIIGTANRSFNGLVAFSGYNVEGTALGYGAENGVVFDGEESAPYFIATYDIDGNFVDAEGFTTEDRNWTSAGFIFDSSDRLTYVDGIPTAANQNGEAAAEQLKIVSLCN